MKTRRHVFARSSLIAALVVAVISLTGVIAGASQAGAATTPLPATLPLLATGLGALGLLDWRRKRKALAVIKRHFAEDVP